MPLVIEEELGVSNAAALGAPSVRCRVADDDDELTAPPRAPSEEAATPSRAAWRVADDEEDDGAVPKVIGDPLAAPSGLQPSLRVLVDDEPAADAPRALLPFARADTERLGQDNFALSIVKNVVVSLSSLSIPA